MFVRKTISKRKHGPDVTYLRLAHNVWDPQSKMTRTQILHSFGRKDELNLESIRRLIKTLSSYLPPQDQLNLLPYEALRDIFYRALSNGNCRISSNNKDLGTVSDVRTPLFMSLGQFEYGR